MYQSIPNLDHPPGQTPGEFFERRIPTPRAQRKCETPTLEQKNCTRTPPRGNSFQISSKKKQHNMNYEKNYEIMENSTKMPICLKHLKAQRFLMGGFYGYSNISNHFPFIYKPTQEIHGKQVPKYDFNK